MANEKRYGSLANAKLPSASTVAVALRCRSKTSVYLFLSHISVFYLSVVRFITKYLTKYFSFVCQIYFDKASAAANSIR